MNWNLCICVGEMAGEIYTESSVADNATTVFENTTWSGDAVALVVPAKGTGPMVMSLWIQGAVGVVVFIVNVILAKAVTMWGNLARRRKELPYWT